MLYLSCVLRENEYVAEECDSDSLQVLYIFLSEDFLSFGEWYKKWLMSSEAGTGGNITVIDKEGENIILSMDPVFETKAFFKVSQQEFLVILNTWEKLYHEKWQEIIIAQDDNGMHLEGKNSE